MRGSARAGAGDAGSWSSRTQRCPPQPPLALRKSPAPPAPALADPGGLTLDSYQQGTFPAAGVSGTGAGMATQLGKRYLCEACGTEILCNKPGSGGVTCCDQEMKLKEAKPLPSSD